MRKQQTIRPPFALILLVAFAVGALLANAGAVSSAATSGPAREAASLIRITPLRRFSIRKRDLQNSRRRSRSRGLGDWVKGYSILFSTSRGLHNDVDYRVSQENNLYTIRCETEARPRSCDASNSRVPEILFLARRDPFWEVWTRATIYTGRRKPIPPTASVIFGTLASLNRLSRRCVAPALPGRRPKTFDDKDRVGYATSMAREL